MRESIEPRALVPFPLLESLVSGFWRRVGAKERRSLDGNKGSIRDCC